MEIRLNEELRKHEDTEDFITCTLFVRVQFFGEDLQVQLAVDTSAAIHWQLTYRRPQSRFDKW